MSSLTETAYHTRRTVNFTIIGIILLIILKISWSIFQNYWTMTHPPPPPPPNVLYGKLPLPDFPKEGKNYNLSLKLETATGNFSVSSPSAKVYFMPLLSANLLSLDRASEKARDMGFNGTPINISTEEYLWSDPQIYLRTLKINIITGNLSLRYDFREDQALIQEKNLPTSDKAIEEAKNILRNYDLLKTDIENGEVNVVSVKLIGGTLTEVDSISEGDFVRVDFNRSKLDDMTIVTPRKDLAVAGVMLSGSNDALKRVVGIDFNYQLIDKENFAGYPVKTPSIAWEELIKGMGYIANLGDEPGKEKVVRNIYLAYYDSLKPQIYLEPIYVFEGDKNFKAYVKAVTSEYLEREPRKN